MGKSKFLMPYSVPVCSFLPPAIRYEKKKSKRKIITKKYIYINKSKNQKLPSGFVSGSRLWGEFKIAILQRKRGDS